MRSSKKRHHRGPLAILCLILVLGVYSAYILSRPIAAIHPQVASATLQVQAPVGSLAWPTTGQSAVGYMGTDILKTYGVQKPVPTASTAKVLTTLAILSKKPLSLNQPGPTITLTAQDVALYNSYVTAEGSVVPVSAGETISEYQVLQAILLPSANNMADSLAIWAFGSLPNYATYANGYAKQLGMKNTHVGSDASGFSPDTTSTAADLVKLGEAAMENPVVAQIVGQASADSIPQANTVKNVNFLLGTDNIVGIKTGNTDQAGGVFISASKTTMNGQPVTVVTALAGTATLFQALQYSLPLIVSAQHNSHATTVVQPGSVAGTYKLPWGGNIQAITSKQLAIPAIGGATLPATITLSPIRIGARAGQKVGTISVKQSTLAPAQAVDIQLKQSFGKPSIWWRLLHPTF